MPVTVNHVLTATTPDNTAYEIKPSAWNSVHSVSLNLSGTDVFPAFSNGGNVTFGTNPQGYITANGGAGGGGVAITAPGASISSGTLLFSNSNGVSFGMNGATLTGSVIAGAGTGFTGAGAVSGTLNAGGLSLSLATQAAAPVGVSAAGSSGNLSTIVFSNSNGVSFGLNGSTITASAAAGGVAVSGSNSSQGAGTVSFDHGAVGNVTFGFAGGTMTANAPGGGAANSASIYAGSNTTNASSTVVALSALSFAGAGLVSVGASNGSIVISAPQTTSYALLSAGISNIGNTAGTTGIASNQFVIAGGANITLSGSTNAGSMTVSIVGGAGGGGGGTASLYGTGNTTQNSSTSLAVSSLLFNGLGAQTVGFSNGSIQLSVPQTSSLSATGALSISVNGNTISIGVAAGGLASASAYMVSQSTGGSSSYNYPLSALSFAGYGAISVGNSNGTIQISGPATTSYPTMSAGFSTGGNTAGTTGFATNQLVLAGGANITLSGSTNGGSMTVSIAGGAGGGGSPTVSAGTTSGALGTIVFSNSNGMSFGLNGSTITGSVPATSSISGTGQVSIAVAGSTISIGVPALGTASFWNPYEAPQSNSIIAGQASVVFQPMVNLPTPISLSRFDILGTAFQYSTSSNSSWAGLMSLGMGIYTLNGSTLSLASSGSQTYAWTNTSNNSSAQLNGGIVRFSVPMNANIVSNGNYWLGVWSSTGYVNSNALWFYNVVVSQMTGTLVGLIGQVSNSTNQMPLGQGAYSTTVGAVPSSAVLSNIRGIGSGGVAAQPLIVQAVNFTA